MLAKVDVIGCQGNRGCHMNKDAPIIKNSNMTTSRITGVKILFFKKLGKNWRHDRQKLAEGLAQQAVVLAENEKKIVDKKRG